MRPVGEFLHSEFRQPSLEAAVVFKRLAAEGKDIENENRTAGKIKKFWCMDCCVENTFPDIDTALEGNCRKCKQPIFRKEENKKDEC